MENPDLAYDFKIYTELPEKGKEENELIYFLKDGKYTIKRWNEGGWVDVKEHKEGQSSINLKDADYVNFIKCSYSIIGINIDDKKVK